MNTAHEPAVEDTMRGAIKRDALARIACGEVLFDGQWIAPGEVTRIRCQARWRATWRLLEILALQAVIALVGLALLLLPLLLL